MAVAIGNMPALGIDIEWTGAKRPVDLIASALEWTDLNTVDPNAFYRGWTFAEAYFKAFQKQPAKALVLHAMKEFPDNRTILMESGVRLLQRRMLPDFQLSLVWKSAETETLVPEYLALHPV